MMRHRKRKLYTIDRDGGSIILLLYFTPLLWLLHFKQNQKKFGLNSTPYMIDGDEGQRGQVQDNDN